MKFKELTEGLRNLVVAIAVIVGGLWTAYIFNAELHIENAQASLDNLKLQASRAPLIEIDIDAEQWFLPGESIYHLHILVQVRNKGNMDTALNILNEPIKVAEVDISSSGKPKFNIVATSSHYGPTGYKTGNLVVAAGEVGKLPFVIKVKEPGLYLIEFEAQMRPSDLLISTLAGADSKWPTVWTTQKYIVIRDSLQPASLRIP